MKIQFTTIILLVIFCFSYSFMTAQVNDLQKKNMMEFLKKKYEAEFGFKMNSKKSNPNSIDYRGGDPIETKLTDNTEISIFEAEPTIAVNPKNPENVVVSFIDEGAPHSRMSIFNSFDGGKTWDRTEFRMDSLFLLDHPDRYDRGGTDPVMAFHSSGRLYFTWLYTGLTDSFQYVQVATYWAWSDDGGKTFQVANEKENRLLASALLVVVFPIEGALLDRPWIAIDNSGGANDETVYIMGSVFDSGDGTNELFGQHVGAAVIYKSPEDDHFKSFLYDFDFMDEVEGQSQFFNLFVDLSGKLHSTFIDLHLDGSIPPKPKKVIYTSTTDFGESFSEINNIENIHYSLGLGGSEYSISERENPMPDLIVHPLSGNIHIVYGAKDTINNFHLGKYAVSKDGGSTWEIDNISNFINQEFDQILMPTIAVDKKSGRISLGFMGLDEHDTGDYYITSSIDEGLTWCDVTKVSSALTNFSNYDDSYFFGDYWDSKLVDDKTFCTWTDGRDSTGPKVYVGVIDHSQPVGVPEILPLTSDLSLTNVYPNPADNEINININSTVQGNVKIDLLDVEGKIYKSFGVKDLILGLNSWTFLLNNEIATGVYLVSISSDYGVFTRRIVIQKR